MAEDKLVSVIIPVFNAEAHIASTLSSIVNQDYSNLEIIIVNDASSDSSRIIAENLLENSGRTFRILDHVKNRGVSAARNTGLDASQGYYVWFCDSDDLPDKRFVSLLCSEAAEKNADAVFCGVRHYHEAEHRFSREPMKLRDSDSSPDEYFDAWASRRIPFWSIWNFIFRRDIITKNLLRFKDGCTFGEDTEFLMKALASSSRISFVRDILYTYVHHGGQTTTNVQDSAMLNDRVLARLRTWRFIAARIKNRRVRNYFLSYYLPHAILKRYTEYARIQDKDNYDRLVRTLKHKKIRSLLLSSARVLLVEPELFFKSATLLYAPNLYYRLRKGDISS